MCKEQTTKERRPCDNAESFNVAAGLDTHAKQLVSGMPHASAFFATFLLHHESLMYSKYQQVASLCAGELGISLLHLRNAPVAFTGNLRLFKKGAAGNNNYNVKTDNMQEAKRAMIESVGDRVVLDLVLAVTLFDSKTMETNAENMEKAITSLLKEMKARNKMQQVVIQFNTRLPENGYMQTLTTNCTLGPKGQLQERNVTYYGDAMPSAQMYKLE